MADCEKLKKCPFFSDQMANMPSVADLMKRTYCRATKRSARGIGWLRQELQFPLTCSLMIWNEPAISYEAARVYSPAGRRLY